MIAECLGEYYRTGELVVYEYIEKTVNCKSGTSNR